MKLIVPYLLGFYERLRWGDGFGRTWSDDQDKNEAYDRGANLADWLMDTLAEVKRSLEAQ